MAIRLDDVHLLTWIWHDAELFLIEILWSDDGEMAVRLRCEINPEEDRQMLINQGIQGPLVNVEFRGATHLQTNLLGICSSREVMLKWNVSNSEPVHHHIEFSCGSTIDLNAEQVWLSEVL